MQYLFFAHSGSEIRQDVIDGDAHASDARLAAALPWLNRDDAFVRHGGYSKSVAVRDEIGRAVVELRYNERRAVFAWQPQRRHAVPDSRWVAVSKVRLVGAGFR